MVKPHWLLMMVWIFAASTFAADSKPVLPPPPADPALLEFIGSWQSCDGTWVDPMAFARIDPTKLATEKPPPVSKPAPPAKQPPPKLARAWEQNL